MIECIWLLAVDFLTIFQCNVKHVKSISMKSSPSSPKSWDHAVVWRWKYIHSVSVLLLSVNGDVANILHYMCKQWGKQTSQQGSPTCPLYYCSLKPVSNLTITGLSLPVPRCCSDIDANESDIQVLVMASLRGSGSRLTLRQLGWPPHSWVT